MNAPTIYAEYIPIFVSRACLRCDRVIQTTRPIMTLDGAVYIPSPHEIQNTGTKFFLFYQIIRDIK